MVFARLPFPNLIRSGELEDTSYWPGNWKEDPDKHVLLLNILQQEKEIYFSNLKDIIQKSKAKMPLSLCMAIMSPSRMQRKAHRANLL